MRRSDEGGKHKKPVKTAVKMELSNEIVILTEYSLINLDIQHNSPSLSFGLAASPTFPFQAVAPPDFKSNFGTSTDDIFRYFF